MKRFKDCRLLCLPNQTVSSLLDEVKQVCEEKKMQISRFDKRYNCIVVTCATGSNPVSSIVVADSGCRDRLSVVNIFPDESSGVRELSMDAYNEILLYFRKLVFDAIASQKGNLIEENGAEYDLEELIPLSYSTLNKWLNGFPLSAHPCDRDRWHDFLCTMVCNREYVEADVFRNFLISEQGWKDSDAEVFAIKYEEEVDLLKAYRERYQ